MQLFNLKWLPSFALLLFPFFTEAQTYEEVDECYYDFPDSSELVALPWYGNNLFLEQYRIQNGIVFPESISAPTTLSTEAAIGCQNTTRFLLPINIWIYRDDSDDPDSAIPPNFTEQIIDYVNQTYSNAGTQIQFYIRRLRTEARTAFHTGIESGFEAQAMFWEKRLEDNSGINMHIIRTNGGSLRNGGMATIGGRDSGFLGKYSFFVRTHENDSPENEQRSNLDIFSTTTHELGHVLGLLHTHHPGRAPASILNEQNATIDNTCYQEVVDRDYKNSKLFCFATRWKSSCEVNGDFLCDTPADPRLTSHNNSVSRQLGYVRLLLNDICVFDPGGNTNYQVDNRDWPWEPDVYNIMSYSQRPCRINFSPDQMTIMLRQAQEWRNEYPNGALLDIEGPDEIPCLSNGDTYTYTMDDGPIVGIQSITWQVSNDLEIVSGQGTRTIQVRYNGAQPIESYLQYTMRTRYGEFCIERPVAVGAPTTPGPIAGPTTVSAGTLTNYSIDPVPYASSYQWTLPYNSGFCTTSNPCWENVWSGTGSQITVKAGSTSGYVQVQAVNNCGVGGTKTLYVQVTDNNGGGCTVCEQTVLSPNPGNGQLQVSLPEDYDMSQGEIQLELRDQQGNLRTSQSTNKYKTMLNTQDLPAGAYYLYITSKAQQGVRLWLKN